MSAAQVAEMLRKEEIVLDERGKGLSFYAIEKKHGIANCDRIWRRAISRTENIQHRRAEAIRLEEQRLDILQENIWDKALSGDSRAVEVALKILERRATMLGLDFSHMISGQMVELEQAKVRLIATALVKALEPLGLRPEQRAELTSTFLNELRTYDLVEVPQGEIA